MDDSRNDSLWERLVTSILEEGPAEERRSRYGDKPAVFVNGREVAHREAPGVVDLRITHHGWSRTEGKYNADPAVRRDSSRRDWIELRLRSPADVDRLQPLLKAAVAANIG